jgi:AraC family transcriptional regulator
MGMLPAENGSRRARMVEGMSIEPCDHIVYSTRDVVAGEFRCPTSYEDFLTAGRINHYVLAFPRTAVWIEREEQPRFVADPGSATVYNPGQPYLRYPISPDGDLADWLGVSERLARDAVRQFSEADAEHEHPFRLVRAPVSTDIYFAQRRLFADFAHADTDELQVEEQALEIVVATLALGYHEALRPALASPRRGRSRRELAESAKAAISARLFENLSVCELAEQVGVSPFHLCRAFRAETGITLHAYRRDIRLRAVLGMTREYRGNLSALALRAGFYSHSHFTTAFRRAFGVSPSDGLTT